MDKITIVAIADIEEAINYWREHEPSALSTGFALGPRSRALANVYGQMIANRIVSLSSDTLHPYQLECLNFRDLNERKNTT